MDMSPRNTFIDPAAFGLGTQPSLSPNLPYPVACGYFSVRMQGGRYGQMLLTIQPRGPGALLGSLALGQHALLGAQVQVAGQHGMRWP